MPPRFPNSDRKGVVLLNYLIIFACYGYRLHGEEGSIDRNHNVPGNRFIEPDADRVMKALGLLDQPPYLMDEKRRHLVLQTIRQVSAHRGWTSFAAHLRTNHVHAVLQADDRPEKVMNAFKVWSSRR